MTTVRILCDNNIGRLDFLGEHGFAALIEGEQGRFLFDTGQGLTLPHNVRAAGLDLRGLQAVVLSHGHYDHTGGLTWVLQQTGPVKVVAHPALFDPHMTRRNGAAGGSGRFIGCPATRAALERAGAEFEFHSQTCELAPGIWFVAGYARNPAQTPADLQLVLPGDDGPQPDPIAEDASLLLDTAAGPVLILCCAHGGVLNILDHLASRLGVSRLHAVLGGTHLMFFPPEKIRAVIERLEACGVAQVGVSHCTGRDAATALALHFGPRFSHAAAGSVFAF
jgi:7,8-dihydropterin-6-yl-methyl-4-(beta-D-ribofuranosyl)aminobenzene 5'-phosphate synthase